MIWKHRDTSFEGNYVDSVHGATAEYDYIALFNSSDTLKREAWAGVNRSGFAIINTVAGNIAENSDDWKDREGFVMSKALSICRTVDDFGNLLDSLPKPLGVRTNFGVLDKKGNGSYFETDDYGYVRYDLSTSDSGILIRSNFACSTNRKGGYGYERYENANAVIARHLADKIEPELFTEFLSRQYYSSNNGLTSRRTGKTRVKDGEFIPRPSSASSVVIELTSNGPVMWTMLGYPPAAITVAVTIDDIPATVKLNHAKKNSEASEIANSLKPEMTDGKYILLPEAIEISDMKREMSLDNYRQFRAKKKKNTAENRAWQEYFH